jgi:UDP-hydrolysing UDP-N-acetyl-D-glucosamine 2-epimerase
LPEKNNNFRNLALKNICVFIGSRANYSSIRSVMRAIQDHPDFGLHVVVGASALLQRFGKVEDLIRKDGFTLDYTFHNIVEGENPTTMAKSTGLGIIEMSMVLDNLKPDYVFVVGDRFEMMAIAIAASYMNIRIIHSMGGEVTGTIDESIRHAITKFAHVHFTANEDARQRIIRMGEDKNYVFNVGCPRIDLVAEELKRNSTETLNNLFTNYKGVGSPLDLNEPFLLASQHPVSTEYGENRWQIEQTLVALNKLKMQTILLWPNIDAGSDDVSKGIRTFREHHKANWLHVFINLPTNVYIQLMNTTSCLVGNSSSGIREGAFIGTPVVNIGTRQNRRMHAKNVIHVGYNTDNIINAIKFQLKNGRYVSSKIYGDGTAGKKIADIMAKIDPPIQKHIMY